MLLPLTIANHLCLWLSSTDSTQVWAAAKPTRVNGAMLMQHIQPVNAGPQSRPCSTCWDAHFLKINAAWKIWQLLMRRLSTVQEPGQTYDSVQGWWTRKKKTVPSFIQAIIINNYWFYFSALRVEQPILEYPFILSLDDGLCRSVWNVKFLTLSCLCHKHAITQCIFLYRCWETLYSFYDTHSENLNLQTSSQIYHSFQ